MELLKKLFGKRGGGLKLADFEIGIDCVLNNDDLLLLEYPKKDHVVVKTSSPAFGIAINNADFWFGASKVRAVLADAAAEPQVFQIGLMTDAQEAALESRMVRVFSEFCRRGHLPTMIFAGVPSEHIKAVNKELSCHGYGHVGVYSTGDLHGEFLGRVALATGASPAACEAINKIVMLVVNTCKPPVPRMYTAAEMSDSMGSLANCIIDSIRTGEGGTVECTATGDRWKIPVTVRPKAAKLRAENQALKELLKQANDKLLTIRETL